MQQWEYKILNSRSINNIEDEINKLGNQGWELVNVVSIGGSGVDYNFKRPKNVSITAEHYQSNSSSQSYTQRKEWTMEEIFPGIGK